MRSAAIWRYTLPMETGIVLRGQRLKQREGALVRVRDGEREGWGEIAPLPGFSLESLGEAINAAGPWLTAWCQGVMLADSVLPSVAFGVSCALAEAAGSLPLAGNYHSAVLCTGDPDALLVRLAQQSHGIAKVKVGLYEPVRDGMMVNFLLEALPTLQLRLDANRSWTLDKARQFARYIAPALRSRIVFLEEPCRTRKASCQFARESAIAIAWDESVREAGFQPQAEPGVKAIIIKPTLTGSITRIRQIVAAAQQQGLVAVIGSSLETSLGLTQLARLAQWLTPGVAPGLDTLELMTRQLQRRWPGSLLPLDTVDDTGCLWRY